jgi:hypothetical protein
MMKKFLGKRELIEAARSLPELGSMPKRDFVIWLHNNYEMYLQFRRFANDAIMAGRKRFSAYMIRERVRWYTNVEYGGEFKISNNLTPYLARLLAKEMPELNEIFTFKDTAAQRELF